MKKSIDEIRKEVEKRLSPEKFAHSTRVAEFAVIIAEAYGKDRDKAEIAALLHDIAWEYSHDEMMEIVQKYNVYLNRYNGEFIPSIHGKVGAAIAEHEFGIEDKDILLAIANHVSGRPCMKYLEIVLYISDHLARGEKSDKNFLYDFVDITIEEALYRIMKHVIDYDVRHNKKIDERTMHTFDWLIEELARKKVKKFEMYPENVYEEFDIQFDRVYKLYKRNMLQIHSVQNIRQTGGYKTKDGRTIKNNMIVRSGALGGISEEDKQALNTVGPNYIIDLRSEHETAMRPDAEIPGMTYISLSLNVTDAKDYSELLLDWYKECDDEDEAVWLSTQYFGALDMDGMYETILNNPNTKKVINEILRIMLKDDCRGILVHCTSGKDRTDIALYYILKLLGVEEDAIKDDYLASQVPFTINAFDYSYKIWEKEYSLDTSVKAVGVISVECDRPEKIEKEIMKNYPDNESFLKDFYELSEVERKMLKDKYLE